jgi:predicted MPP superfamily phosphohydrolase
MRIAWATDVHFEFLSPAALTRFVVQLAESPAEAFLLGGDISHAHGIEKHLRILERALERPIYFVLGNHDYYHGNIARVRSVVETMTAESKLLRWLPAVGAVALSESTGLIGHGGWADGRAGDFANSPVSLNDFKLIEDFLGLERAERLARMQQLAGEAADFFLRELPPALERWTQVIVLTHVPPFARAAWQGGRMSDQDWLPFFASEVVGDVLKPIMKRHPTRQLLVLAGHTHSPGEVAILPNLKVVTGGARYGFPQVQRVWEV